MKVLHLISGLRGGGAEHFVLELCRHSLREKETDMKILSLSAADEIAHKFHDAGITVLSASSSGKRRGINAFRGLIILLKHPRSIVHAHMFHACVIACFAKLLRPSIKIIFTLHNNHVPEVHRQLFMFLTKPLRKADIIFPGIELKWYQKKNAVCIQNGIDTERFNSYDADKPPLFTCAFVGRLSEEKNPLFLVELANTLLPERNFIIRIAGEGPLKNKLIQNISNEKLGGHFILHGHVENIPHMLAECHCLLMPSLWEGMPLILLEAGAAGIPVIATPVGSIPSVLNSNNGFAGDTENFRSLLTDVIDNYGEALIKARRLRQLVKKDFNIEISYRKHICVYSQ